MRRGTGAEGVSTERLLILVALAGLHREQANQLGLTVHAGLGAAIETEMPAPVSGSEPMRAIGKVRAVHVRVDRGQRGRRRRAALNEPIASLDRSSQERRNHHHSGNGVSTDGDVIAEPLRA